MAKSAAAWGSPSRQRPSEFCRNDRTCRDYSLRLREKQKARFIYGVLEKQFRRTFEHARREPGETGLALFALLERRLDNVVFRMGLATTRAQARQIVCHGHITVNGRKTNIPSYVVRAGETIAVRSQSRSSEYFKALQENGAGRTRVPAWVQFDMTQLSGSVVTLTRREDAEPGINEQLIVEFYSR